MENQISNRARLTAPWPLAIGRSKIPGAGLGVISNAALPCCAVFGPYQGRIINKTVDSQESGYGWQIRTDDDNFYCVDAVDETVSNWMRFVNCPTSEEQVNLAAFQFKNQIYYKTLKPIGR